MISFADRTNISVALLAISAETGWDDAVKGTRPSTGFINYFAMFDEHIRRVVHSHQALFLGHFLPDTCVPKCLGDTCLEKLAGNLKCTMF